MNTGFLKLEPIDVNLLKEPKHIKDAGEALELIAQLREHNKALSQQAAPYRRWLNRLNRRMVAVNKQINSLQKYFAPGITIIEQGVTQSFPNINTIEDLEKYIATLKPEELEKFLEAYSSACGN